MSRLFTFASVLLAATRGLAQTFTDCNPLNSTECPSDTALGTYHTWNFTNTSTLDSKIWKTTAGTVDLSSSGAAFTINEQGDSPTIMSNFYIFFGQVSVIMRCANGTGIVSSVVLESDDLDEVDWEWVGGNNTIVETNYFGKGNTTSYDRATWVPVDDPQVNEHNYTLIWTKEKIDWIIDGTIIRTLNYEDALNGENFPQTPMNVRLGVWAAGDVEKNSIGTVEWAQGATNYSGSPYTMTISSVYIEDYSSGSNYTYGDTSGSYGSIEIGSGNSTIKTRLEKVTGPKATFHSLPQWAQITIAASVIGVFAIGSIIFAFCCIKSRRAGRQERITADAAWEKQEMEMAMLKQQHREDYHNGVPIRGYDPKKVAVARGKYVE